MRGVKEYSDDLIVIYLNTKLEGNEELIDTFDLAFNEGRYRLKSEDELVEFLNLKLDKKLHYRIFVNNNTKFKTLTHYTDKGSITENALKEVLEISVNKQHYSCLRKIFETDLPLEGYIQLLKENKEIYSTYRNIPKTFAMTEKDRLAHKLQFNSEWIEYANTLKIRDENTFNLMKKCKTGGLYNNCKPLGSVIHNVYSYDMTSAYIYQMLSKPFPYGKYILLDYPDYAKIEENLKEKLYIIVFKANILCNISKASMYIDRNADYYVMTNDMFDTFRDIYLYDDFECIKLIVYPSKRLLPIEFRKYLIQLLRDKQHCEKGSIAYKQCKTRLNLWYGLGLQALSANTFRQYQCYKSFSLPPIIGLWTLGYQMKDLNKVIRNVNMSDLVKIDTDSITYQNTKNNIFFETFNKEVELRLKQIYGNLELYGLGKFHIEYTNEDIVLLGNKQYALLKSEKLKASGCYMKFNTEKLYNILENQKVTNGVITYYRNDHTILYRDYRFNNDFYRLYKEKLNG